MKKALSLAMTSAMFAITNPYWDLPNVTYSGSRPPLIKEPLTKKQRKARASNKTAKLSRKKNRK